MSNPPPNITYDDAVMAANVAQTVKQEQEAGILNKRYIPGPHKEKLPGILKAAETLLTFIAYIPVELSTRTCGYPATMGYFSFVSMTVFIASLILWAMLLLKVPQRILRCDCVKWPFLEMCFYFGVLVMYFFADLMLAIQACTGGQKAGCAFGWFTLFVFIGDAFLAFRVWRESRSQAMQSDRTTSPGTDLPPDIGDNKY